MGNLKICGQPKKFGDSNQNFRGQPDEYLGTCIMFVGMLRIIRGTYISWDTTKIKLWALKMFWGQLEGN